MVSGLDLSDCRLVTNERGEIRADIPYATFSMLVRIAVLRTEIERIEHPLSSFRESDVIDVPIKDYPDSVLAYMNEGKSPLTAWRLYRRLSIAEVATRYGTTPSNIKRLERSHTLQQRTRAKLAAVFACRPAQLLRPHAVPSCSLAP